MKKRMYTYFFVLFGLILMFGSCRKDDTNEAIYITGTEIDPVVNISAEEGANSSIGVSVTSSTIVSSDISVSLKTDPNLVYEFNKRTGKNYLPVPEGDYELLGQSVTITTGQNVSDVIDFRIKTIKNFEEGSSYMMAVTINSSSGSIGVLESSRTIYYVVRPIIIQTVASLSNSTAFKPRFTPQNASHLTDLSQASMECRVYVNQFQSRSPFISSVMGIEEHFLMRFGDVIIKPNQIQRAGMIALTAPQELSTGKWYHLAIVHDVSQTRIYVDGVLSGSVADNNNINLLKELGSGAYGTGFLIGTSAGSRYLDGMISEARLWSKALTQTEIIDGMCGINHNNSSADNSKKIGLIGYWKFNDGAGKIATDYSGNGYHADANQNVSWIPNVRCE